MVVLEVVLKLGVIELLVDGEEKVKVERKAQVIVEAGMCEQRSHTSSVVMPHYKQEEGT